MNKILNLTGLPTTSDQAKLGVYDPSPELAQSIQEFMEFQSPPDIDEMASRTRSIREALACSKGRDFRHTHVLITPPAFFAPILEFALSFNFQILYPFYNKDGAFVGFVEETQSYIHPTQSN